MFNYTACTRPLWRILVAQCLTIAVALLIELAMVEPGLAQCLQKQCSLFPQVRAAASCMAAYYPIRIENKVALVGKKKIHLNSLSGLLAIHKTAYPHENLTEGDVWNLTPQNDDFREKRIKKTCACVGDDICFIMPATEECPYLAAGITRYAEHNKEAGRCCGHREICICDGRGPPACGNMRPAGRGGGQHINS
jgi:hypothetical protein